MFCPYCGNQLPDDAHFCNRCGQPIQQGNPSQTPYEQPEQPQSGGNAAKIVLILVIAVVAIAILAAGSILMKNNIETQRAIRDAQQAQEEAEKERAKYGDVPVEEDDASEDEETPEEEAADWVGGSGYDLIYFGSTTKSTLDRCRVLLRYVE